jgi:hypothetical protein
MTRSVLDPQSAARLVKLCGMLGSEHDGERAAAAFKADRMLRDQLNEREGAEFLLVQIKTPMQSKKMPGPTPMETGQERTIHMNELTSSRRVGKPITPSCIRYRESLLDQWLDARTRGGVR